MVVGLLRPRRLELSDDGVPSVMAQEVQPLGRAHVRAARLVTIRLDEQSATPEKLTALRDLVSASPGQTPLLVDLETKEGWLIRMRPNSFLRIEVTESLVERMRAIDPRWTIDLSVAE